MDISVLDLLTSWLKVKAWQTLLIFFNLYVRKGSFKYFIRYINEFVSLSLKIKRIDL